LGRLEGHGHTVMGATTHGFASINAPLPSCEKKYKKALPTRRDAREYWSILPSCHHA
jgi:hypothetical protein